METATKEDDSSRAYANISADLDQWISSPGVQTSSSSSWRTYEEDSVVWLKNTLDRSAADGEMTTSENAISVASPETPVMTNLGKKQASQISPLTLNVVESHSARDEPPFDILARDIMHPEVQGFRLFHDALWKFLDVRKKVSSQLLLEMQGDSGTKMAHALTTLDVEFLSTLSVENNIWSLLATLRVLGIDSLLWDDSDGAKMRNQMIIAETVTNLSTTSTSTGPIDILEALHGKSSPLILQRRRVVLGWMQDCLVRSLPSEHVASKPSMWPNTLRRVKEGMASPEILHPDAPFLVDDLDNVEDGILGDDASSDAELLRSCLPLMLAGRFEKVERLCLKHGQPWRAAAWSGNNAIGKVSPFQSRSLWKRLCWQTARAVKGEEAAIYAFLCDDVETAMNSAALNSWEEAFVVCFHAMMSRLEDELLFKYNTHPKPTGKFGLGREWEAQETSQLVAADVAASLDEESIVERLGSSPSPKVKASTLNQKAAAAFVVGRNAVAKFLSQESSSVDAHDTPKLRFLVHVALFVNQDIDKAIASNERRSDVSKKLLTMYLECLASRPDLWCTMTLYASLLPRKDLLIVYPKMLRGVDIVSERPLILQQMQALLEPKVVLDVLRSVVDLQLKDKANSPSKKIDALDWLLLDNAHFGEALVYGNSLIRAFLLDNDFVNAGKVEALFQGGQGSDTVGLEHARAELFAIRAFLAANSAFDKWKGFLKDNPRTIEVHDFQSGEMARSRSVAAIALSAQRREALEQAQEKSARIAEIAGAAETQLSKVLTMDGGFLLEEGDDDEETTDDDPRRRELSGLRKKFLPKIVFMVHEVCNETALWLEAILHGCVPVVANSASAALREIYGIEELDSIPVSPLYWVRQIKTLVNSVAADEYRVHDVLSSDTNKVLLERIRASVLRGLFWCHQ